MFELQASLFDSDHPIFDAQFDTLERSRLSDGAWVDYCPGWLSGDIALFEALTSVAPWEQPVVRMYDRDVRTPRLVARMKESWHPIIDQMSEALTSRYGVDLVNVSAGWYRDGNDSVAFHGDRIARERESAIVATVSLGGPRRFNMRPKAGGPSVGYSLGHGDLIVMGGTCQRTWEHSIPKVATAPPRIALMFRQDYI